MNKQELINKIDKYLWQGKRPMKFLNDDDTPHQPGCGVADNAIKTSPLSLTQLKELKKFFLEVKENYSNEWFQIVGGLSPDLGIEILDKRINEFKVDNEINLVENRLEEKVDKLDNKLENIELLLKNLIEQPPK